MQPGPAPGTGSEQQPGASAGETPGGFPIKPTLHCKINPVQHVSMKPFAYEKSPYSDNEMCLQKISE